MRKVDLGRKIQFIGIVPCIILAIIYVNILNSIKNTENAISTLTIQTKAFCMVFTVTYLASYLPLLRNDMFDLGATKYVIHLL